MYQNYFPQTDAQAKLWLENYQTKIQEVGASLGLLDPQIDAEVALCEVLINNIGEVVAKREELASAVANKNSSFDTELKSLRENIAFHKKNPSYTPGIGAALGVVGSSTDLDTDSYKPILTAGIFGGFVRLKFTKKGVEGVYIYHRKKGEATWKFLALDTKSPYDDHIDLAVAAQPEHWEYQCYAMLNDAQIGVASDIVEVVFAG